MTDITKTMFGYLQIAWAIGIWFLAYLLLYIFQDGRACMAFLILATLLFPNVWAYVFGRPDLLENNKDTPATSYPRPGKFVPPEEWERRKKEIEKKFPIEEDDHE